ncbi:MAG: hypothetical protein U0075_08555 [Thermomicrobiales bacterium]
MASTTRSATVFQKVIAPSAGEDGVVRQVQEFDLAPERRFDGLPSGDVTHDRA